MAISKLQQNDLKILLSRRCDNGGDFWATADGRWGKGSPFSTFDCILILHELGVARTDPVIQGAAERVLASWQEDGRFRPAPTGSIFPCHTANAARALCRIGYARDARMKRTFEKLFKDLHEDGGWRCNRSKLGMSTETDASNPGVTLAALDAFRFSRFLNADKRLDQAANTLLCHWKTREPLGPCGFGIGTLFSQVEYPFLRYNLFYYVYVLSFYDAAKKSAAFKQAHKALESKLVDGKVVVENPHRQLSKLTLCARGEVSALATKRYREIVGRVGSRLCDESS